MLTLKQAKNAKKLFENLNKLIRGFISQKSSTHPEVVALIFLAEPRLNNVFDYSKLLRSVLVKGNDVFSFEEKAMLANQFDFYQNKELIFYPYVAQNNGKGEGLELGLAEAAIHM